MTGKGGTCSPYDEVDDRVDCVFWKKPEEAGSDEMGEDDLVAVPGLCTDGDDECLLADEGREAVVCRDDVFWLDPVLGRPLPEDRACTEIGFGNGRSSVALSVLGERRISKVERYSASFCMSSGKGGTGGGVEVRGRSRYLSLSPPVLIRLTSFHHLPSSAPSSSRSLCMPLLWPSLLGPARTPPPSKDFSCPAGHSLS